MKKILYYNNQAKDKNKHKKINSVFLFKSIYNKYCDDNKNEISSSYKIKNDNINKYDLNKCINDNITDYNSRYLLLEIQSSLSLLIYQNIKIQNLDKNMDFYEGSPFIFTEDNNDEYKYKKVNEIQEDIKSDKLIILQNLNQIQPFLYDLYNMNYEIIDEKKYTRICLDNFSG